MKLCRFQLLEFNAAAASRAGEAVYPEPRIGRIEGDTFHELSGSLIGKTEATGRSWKLTEVALLPPTVPTKIVCVGRNYVEHAAEFNNDVPKEPLIFLKPPSAITAPGEPIVLPAISK